MRNLIGRAMVGYVTPLTLPFTRWLVAVAVMMPFAWPKVRAHWPLIRREIYRATINGTLRRRGLPAAAIKAPATSGPTMREKFTATAFSANAAGS